MGVSLEGKNLLQGSKFFPLRVDPNEKEDEYFHVKIISFKGLSIAL